MIIQYLFRSFFYVLFGISMEVLFSATLLNLVLGFRTSPRLQVNFQNNYREGFVSLYMIPLYALGIPFLFEPIMIANANLYWMIRVYGYACLFTCVEALYGFILEKTLGLYPWDYYKYSKYKVFNNGYTLYTLIPFWAICGFVLEQYCKLMIYLSPYIEHFFMVQHIKNSLNIGL